MIEYKYIYIERERELIYDLIREMLFIFGSWKWSFVQFSLPMYQLAHILDISSHIYIIKMWAKLINFGIKDKQDVTFRNQIIY